MYKPSRTSQGTFKLPKLDRRVPNLEIIGQCLMEAQKMMGRTVEQPFSAGKPVYTYCLSCHYDSPGTAPLWHLHLGEGPTRDTLWSHQTTDTSLIASLVSKECPADGDSRAAQSTTFGPSAQTAAISLTRIQAMNSAAGVQEGQPVQEAAGYFKKSAGERSDPQGGGAIFQNAAMPQVQFQIQNAYQQGARVETKEETEKSNYQRTGEGQGSPAVGQPGYGSQDNGNRPASGSYPKPPTGGLLGTPELGSTSGSRPPVSAWGISPQSGALINKEGARPEAATNPVAPRPEIKMTYGGDQAETAPYQTTAIPHSFMNPPSYTKRPPTLEGALTDMTPPSLLQSMQIGKMTGVLMVISNEDMVEVYFEDGAPIHAVAPDTKGEAAVMELLTWDVGKFAFYPNERTTERTVRRRMEGMLMESAPLMDQYRYLHEVGLSMDSFIIRRQGPISEPEFEQRMERGARMDMQKQKAFYQLVDNKSTLFDLLRKMPMPKVEWIPTLYNLICCDLVAPATSHKREAATAPLESMGINRAPIDAVLAHLKNPETGLINYPVIWHFLEQEYCRSEHTGSAFCIVMFEMRYRTQTGLELLPAAAVQEAARRIGTVKRNIDYLAHFEPPSFILVLPATQLSAATLVAKRLCDILWDSSLGGPLDTRSLALAFGVACHPEESQDLAGLLTAARDALNQSKRSGSPVISAKKQ